MEQYAITQSEMNLVLAAVEHGFQSCEHGDNLEMAIKKIFELYSVIGPEPQPA